MKKNHFIGLLLSVSLGLPVMAQQDMTSSIVNPSFEQNLDGWQNDGMSAQGNTAFKLKVGNTYCEKWTGKGGHVGDGSIRQTVSGLKAGLYTVTCVAQNIQEDTPTAVQSGVNVIANSAMTSINVANTYSVQIIVIDGQLELGMVLQGATGNYVTVDDFHLTLEEATNEVYTNMHQQMQTIVDEAKQMSQNNGTAEQQELDAARLAVEALIAQQTSEGVTDAVKRLQSAIYDYKLSVASDDEMVDMTSAIQNPSFEKNGAENWINVGMGTQTGGVFPTSASGNTFIEAWTWGGNHIGDVSVSQSIALPNGKYVLTARCQNIQQGSNDAASKGGYLFGEDVQTEVGKANDYNVEFVVIEGKTNIGFKTVSATGNWVCADYFRIFYKGRNDQMLLATLKARYEAAEALTDKHMKSTVLSDLQTAIEEAKAVTVGKGMESLAVKLRECMEAAQSSIDAYAQLKQAIDKAMGFHQDGTDDAEFLASIATAQQVYDENSATESQISDAIAQLDKDILKYCVANSTGTAPKVTTVAFVARGATGALGRSTVSGSDIMEKGFCWSTEHNPTVLDNRTTFTYDINGPMYLMQPLEPATVYYVRAYAMTKDYAVGYGEERKVITLPMGTSTYWYNWGAPADANERINNALADCIYYYNNWSCTTNFNISCSYGSGTPTADCGYGGGMRVGPNASYQRTGTILHESNHGVGVGTQGRWWDSNLHDGAWKGYRANSLLQFIENNPTATMAGDNMHMWPYGINGAHEDSGWPMLYIANVMITQALHEDGLIPPGHGGCKPAYVFEQDDDTKYYITAESDKFGSGVAYLTENSTGVLSWSTVDDVTSDDAYAWYTTFDPKRQLYTIRNAKSGRYFSYSGGIKTVTKTNPAETEYFHLMIGRQEKSLGSSEFGVTTRPYWIMAGNDVEAPSTLTATANGKTSSNSFNIGDNATQQRWFILTAEQVYKAANGKVDAYQDRLRTLIANLRDIQQTPYVENEPGSGCNATLLDVLDDMEGRLATESSADVLNQMYDETFQAGMDYLNAASVIDEATPYDITFLVENPTIMESTDGWTCASQPGYSFGCAEYYQSNFDFNQTLKDMPLGKYKVTVQGFQRPGAWDNIYTKWESGKAAITSMVYAGTKTSKLSHICDGGQTHSVGGVEKQVGNMYIPDNMEAASLYFDQGCYQNEVLYTASSTRQTTANIKFGVKSSNNTASGYWSIFRNFHLYYYGRGISTGIEAITLHEGEQDGPIYDLQGRRIQHAMKGLYIVGGKKVLVR